MSLKNISITTFMIIAINSCNDPKPVNTSTEQKAVGESSKGAQAPGKYFTGKTWVYPVGLDSISHWSVGKVSFEAGSHSNWHTHTGKQILAIIDGVGYLKEKNKAIQTLRKGDVVIIEPGVVHWHGASFDTSFVQLVVNPNIKNGIVNWMGPVSDEEYHNGQ